MSITVLSFHYTEYDLVHSLQWIPLKPLIDELNSVGAVISQGVIALNPILQADLINRACDTLRSQGNYFSTLTVDLDNPHSFTEICASKDASVKMDAWLDL